MDEDPAQARAPQEGLHARARRRGGARRQGVGDGLGRQHRRHDGLGAAAHGPDQGRQAARPSPPRSPCPARRRPSCSTPAPTPRCQAEWLVQFAQMGSVYARHRFGIDEPEGRPAVDRRGARQGRHRCARRPTSCSQAAPGINFIGNVEGRDMMTDDVDVVVTDGFTGNVVLKTLEGGMKALVGGAARRVRRRRRQYQAARRRAACRRCCRSTTTLDPDTYGGADAARRRRRVHHQPRLVQRAEAMVNAIGVGQRDGRGRHGRRDPRRHRRQRLISVARARPAVADVGRPAGGQPCRPRPRRAGPIDRDAGLRDRPRPPRRHPRDRAVDDQPRASRSSTTSTPTRWR